MAELVNQGRVRSVRKASIAFWAWVVSIVLHIAVLGVLGVVKFSHSEADVKQRPVVTANVSQVRKFLQSSPVIPKPKIKKTTGEQFLKSAPTLPAKQIFDAAKSCSQDISDFAKPSASTGQLAASSVELSRETEFFGSWTDQRKLCYLVDCSGSMQGVFGRVQRKLKESIAALQPDQYFCIIFFGSDRLFEFGDGHLLRATVQTKSAACSFIESIRPAGGTNAMAALERAMQVRDDFNVSPAVIYFLTDGFELTTADAREFSQKISNLLERFAPATKINTIGFWPSGDDRKMLEIIAKQSSGEVLVVDY